MFIKNKKDKGITLIALVVTIIVLLILAGISIQMLVGEGGILTNARDASDKTGRANAIEMAQLDVLDAKASDQGKLTEDKFKEILARYFDFDTNTDLSELTLTTKDGKYNDIKASEIYNGEFAAKEKQLAKEVLTINPDGAQDYEKSPYVKYNGILCRVFYNDEYEEGKHGLQIISADNIKATGTDEEEKVTLGDSSDFDKSMDDYNKAVNILNNKAKEYMSNTDKQGDTVNKIAIDARSLGSIAKLKDGKFQGDITEKRFDTSKYDYLSGYEEQFLDTDDNCIEDVGNDTGETTGQLQKLDLNATSATWLASRCIYAAVQSTSFSVRYIISDGSIFSSRKGDCAVCVIPILS